MAVHLQRSSVRSRGRHRTGPMSEINVTPMVDVMLVLLVIFMVTAPLLTVGVKVDLPKTAASVIPDAVEPLAVTIDAEGRLYLQDQEVDLDKLVPRLIAISGANPDIRVFVRGDKSTNYGWIMEIMGTINAAGFTRLALIAELPRGRKAKPSSKKAKRK